MSFKASGGVNWWHYLSWLKRHLEDAIRQDKVKKVLAETLEGRRLRRLVRTVERLTRKESRKRPKKKSAEDQVRDDMQEVTVPPAQAKFGPIGAGIVFCREEMALGPARLNDAPPEWVKRGYGQLDEFIRWKDRVGDWHCGYRTNSTNKPFDYWPNSSAEGGLDERFFECTFTMASEASEAISESLRAGELKPELFLAFLERFRDRLLRDDIEERISCGAPNRLQLVCLTAHPEDGVLHFHPAFIKSAPMYFRQLDGAVVPPSQAPGRGRRKKGSGMQGGERCGLIGNTGKLVTNSLGVALCAADNYRAMKMPPPIEFGTDWELLDFFIKSRSEGVIDKKGTKAEGRARAVGLGEPFDLLGTRWLREEVAWLEEQCEPFKVRHAQKIAASLVRAEEMNRRLVEMIAGKELTELRAAKEEMEAKLKLSEKERDAEKQRAEKMQDVATESVVLTRDLKSTLRKTNAENERLKGTIAALQQQLVTAESPSGTLSAEFKETVSACFELAAEALRAALSDRELPDGAGDFLSATYDAQGGFELRNAWRQLAACCQSDPAMPSAREVLRLDLRTRMPDRELQEASAPTGTPLLNPTNE